MKKEDETNVSERSPGDELNRLLHLWGAPEAPASLDERMLESYRRLTDERPFWERFFSSSIRVPVPVAMAALLLLLLSAALAMRQPTTATVPEASTFGPPTQAADLEASVVTHTSLAGFMPATEEDASVVLEGVPQ